MSEPNPTPRPAGPIDRAFLYDGHDHGELILVRHGQQEPHVGVNRKDPPLSEMGRRQAEAVGRHLSAETIDAVYSSHLHRARDTGAAIAGHHDADLVVREDLREIEVFRDLPDGGAPLDHFDRIVLAGVNERFMRERRWSVYPASERSGEFRDRVVTAIDGILASHVGERVVVACHGGVISAYLAVHLGLREDMFYRPFHASVHRVAFGDGRRVIRTLNETHYLRDGEESLVTV